MKYLAALAILAITTLAACSPDSLTGSGTITTQQRSTTQFSSIDVSGNVDVIISKGASSNVAVETDENLQDKITTTIANGTLKIRQSSAQFSKAVVHLTAPEINSIITHTTGSITVQPGFNHGGMVVYSDAPGNIVINDIKLDALTVEVSGTGNLTIDGQATSFSCQHRGTGTVHALDFATSQSAVAIYNSGDASVNVTNKLFADILGSGNIFYTGNPQVTLVSKGTGSLTKLP
ncbi:MAG: DUF2807 domain-containing protein [Bradyrhizobiaceae bacterium]|nr:DUF2807 domain-containing protein [Bradyrhizobiaceae bacterium]